MTIKKLTVLIACLASFAVLSACGGGGSSNNPPPSLSIAFQGTPPSSMVAGTQTPLTAVVSNDSSNAGVDWTVTCGSSGACGSFQPAHTASGSATTFTAPPAIPSGGTVTVTGTATADHTQTVTATIGITTSGFDNTALNGNYVFEVLGTDVSTGFFYQMAGVLTADGAGSVIGGELTYSNANQVENDTIASGDYSIGADGRGTISFDTGDDLIGVNGVITLGVVVLSGSQSLITQFDTSATSSGSMVLQTSTAMPAGGYAFVANGFDVTNGDALAIGGVLNIDTPGFISGAGSAVDANDGGSISLGLPVDGNVTAPDQFGAVIFDLSVNGQPVEMDGFIIDATHMMLIEDDDSGSTAGLAIGQGAATGTFADNSAFSGAFTYGMSGQSSAGPAAFAALFTADGGGNLTNGLTDENFGGEVVTDTLTGTYEVDGTGTGRVLATTNFGTNGAGPTLMFYLSGSGNPPLVLNIDTFSAGTGIALPQASPFTFDGPYGLNFTAVNGDGETDGTAQLTADSVAGTFSGMGDINIVFVPTPNLPVSGTFTPDPSGRFNSTLTSGDLTVSTALYLADSTRGFIIENDSQQVALGSFGAQQQPPQQHNAQRRNKNKK